MDLWREFAGAVRDHVALLKEQERADDADLKRSLELEPLAEAAAAKREAARMALQAHRAEEHGEGEPRTMTA